MSAAAPAAWATRSIEEIAVGETATLVRTITPAQIEAFAELSGDRNPLHVDVDYARRTTFQRPVAHGMLLGSFVSTLIGMHLPGPGALWNQQSFKWLQPVFAGDTVTVEGRVTQVSKGAAMLTVAVTAVNQNGKKVMEGEGTVMLLSPREEEKAGKTLAERVVLVSGASRGIGRATALEFARAGARVGVNYLRREDAAEELCREIAAGGGRAFAVQADVAIEGDVKRAVERVSESFGQPVDVLVNNACLAPEPKGFLDTEWDDFARMLDVQLRGAYACSRAVLPAMVAQGSGAIVNIGSSLVKSAPPPQWSAWVAAKSALLGLTRALAVEFGPKGVRVNMVSPGTTETDAIAAVPERLRKVQAMQTPLRRLGDAADVARTVVFLCSEGGRYITGADVPVSGGSAI
ncbi:MAG: SDR family oxidoreductase [Bryobacteraceae bacterium]